MTEYDMDLYAPYDDYGTLYQPNLMCYTCGDCKFCGFFNGYYNDLKMFEPHNVCWEEPGDIFIVDYDDEACEHFQEK